MEIVLNDIGTHEMNILNGAQWKSAENFSTSPTNISPCFCWYCCLLIPLTSRRGGGSVIAADSCDNFIHSKYVRYVAMFIQALVKKKTRHLWNCVEESSKREPYRINTNYPADTIPCSLKGRFLVLNGCIRRVKFE